MAKALKFYSGSAYLTTQYERKGARGKQVNVYIAAYSKKEGLELLNTICSGSYGMSHFNNFFGGTWGTPMEAERAMTIDPCVYVDETWSHLHRRLVYSK